MTAPQKSGVIHYYDTHPINEDEILARLKAQGVNLDNFSEHELKEFDQDHYGGIEVVDTLTERAGIQSEHHVLDVCCGMGGPARWIAQQNLELFKEHGCQVEIHEDLSEQWRDTLVKRLAMYRSLQKLTVAKFGKAHFDNWDRIYSHYVGLFVAGKLRWHPYRSSADSLAANYTVISWLLTLR